MLGRALSLVAALLLACASTGAHGYARALQPESAHRGFATHAEDAHPAPAHVTPEAASENSATPAEASDGRRFYAKARYYGAGRGGFISVDPWDGDIANPVSLNKYLYGYANPGVYIDPDGRCSGNPNAEFALGPAGCAQMDAEIIGADLGTREGVNAVIDHQAKTAALQATVLVAAPLLAEGGSVAALSWAAARAGGWRLGLATATHTGAGVAEVTAGVGLAAVGAGELPPTPMTVLPKLAASSTARALDASLDAARPVIRYGDDAARVAAQSDVPAAPIVNAEQLPTLVVEDAKGGMPDWLRERFAAGEDFNRRQRVKYPFNEVYVEAPCTGGSCLRLDSYDPRAGEAGEIVSRKYTQLAEVQPQTATNYLREIERKYAPGTVIADVPTNRATGLAGTQLQGQMYLEVPTQNAPVPQGILDEAKRRDIRIRDENGNEL